MTKEEVIKKVESREPLYYLTFALPCSIYTLTNTNESPRIIIEDINKEDIVTIKTFHNTVKATFSKEIALKWLKESLEVSLKNILKRKIVSIIEVQIVLFEAKKHNIDLDITVPKNTLRELIHLTEEEIIKSKKEIKQFEESIEYYKRLEL